MTVLTRLICATSGWKTTQMARVARTVVGEPAQAWFRFGEEARQHRDAHAGDAGVEGRHEAVAAHDDMGARLVLLQPDRARAAGHRLVEADDVVAGEIGRRLRRSPPARDRPPTRRATSRRRTRRLQMRSASVVSMKRIARSASRRMRSSAALPVSTSTVSVGCCACSSGSRRIRKPLNDSEVVTRTMPSMRWSPPATRRSTAATARSASSASGTISLPASVSTRPSGARLNRLTPSAASSASTRRPTVECRTPRLRAGADEAAGPADRQEVAKVVPVEAVHSCAHPARPWAYPAARVAAYRPRDDLATASRDRQPSKSPRPTGLLSSAPQFRGS